MTSFSLLFFFFTINTPSRCPKKAGYNSHYVLTEKDGDCVQQKKKHGYYDEVVIEQESQIAPVYLIKLNRSALKSVKILDDWTPHERDTSSVVTKSQQHANVDVLLSTSVSENDMMIPLLDL